MSLYIPPYQITPSITNLIAEVSEQLGVMSVSGLSSVTPYLRKNNQIKSIHASLEIENNTLSLEQVTAVISGKRVLGLPREIKEVQNAFKTYEIIETFDPYLNGDFLKAHNVLLSGIEESAGNYRSGGVGIMQESKVIHFAPQADRVPDLMKNLFDWMISSPEHPLIKSSVFHYETEFIHPFSDGNGRMGRLWQTVILAKWKPLFYYIPVESVIRDNQTEYYRMLGEADSHGESTVFIEFIIKSILTALREIHSDQVSDQVGDQVKKLLILIGENSLSSGDIMKVLELSHRTNFRHNYLNPAIDAGFIEMLIPDKPSSSLQKYRLTAKGLSYIKKNDK